MNHSFEPLSRCHSEAIAYLADVDASVIFERPLGDGAKLGKFCFRARTADGHKVQSTNIWGDAESKAQVVAGQNLNREC